MRRRATLWTTAILIACSAATALAQRPGGGMMGGPMGFGLLRNQRVQAELKMTPDQVSQIQAKQQDMMQQLRQQVQAAGGFQGMSDADRAALREKMQTMQHDAIASVLTQDQMKRFDQLELQRMGAMALDQKAVQDKLNLSDDQRSSIHSILQQEFQDMQALRQGGGGGAPTPQDRQKMGAIRRAADEKLVGVLTDDQKRQWKEMQGTKFDFGPGGFGGPGGRGGRRGGAGGPGGPAGGGAGQQGGGQ